MIRINLLPARVSKKKQAGTQQLVLLAVVVIGGLVGNYLWAASRGSDLATREAQLREKLEVLDRLKAGRTGPVKMLDQLAQLTPKRLWLTKLEQKGDALAFTGVAASIDEVSELMTALKGSTYFKDVELKKTSAKTDKAFRLVEFALSANVVYPGAPVIAAPTPGKK
ncbi:Fimbrial assembly family protein [Anaeromyxobacter dehalogenans 2CP-1]|uniref:Fimbrial assembly family protein n=1 Tax=Anaeromyxobacter dehalogenans (strain ATCC BAA-258 / DSM 21875 / 2CP-1) TaxID=455488 RepID=B8JD05_ANAD2|nr:PilN domain-containing protein [Anaeromyxobacter dehalogenans]ACL64033.1 Fimbrial assembly family protein [Anaeromyxobacter dehalogenans 2CP-1]